MAKIGPKFGLLVMGVVAAAVAMAAYAGDEVTLGGSRRKLGMRRECAIPSS